jgi:hypothetical protein
MIVMSDRVETCEALTGMERQNIVAEAQLWLLSEHIVKEKDAALAGQAAAGAS